MYNCPLLCMMCGGLAKYTLERYTQTVKSQSVESTNFRVAKPTLPAIWISFVLSWCNDQRYASVINTANWWILLHHFSLLRRRHDTHQWRLCGSRPNGCGMRKELPFTILFSKKTWQQRKRNKKMKNWEIMQLLTICLNCMDFRLQTNFLSYSNAEFSYWDCHNRVI